MPAADVRFAEWLANKPLSGVQIDTIQIEYDFEVLYLANKTLDVVSLVDEAGIAHDHVPYDFKLTSPKKSQSTESTLNITGPGLNGELLKIFGNVRGADLNGEGFVTWRPYIIPTAMDKPQLTPPPRFAIISVTISRSGLQIESAAPRLPRHRAGKPYTAEEFPGLVVIG